MENISSSPYEFFTKLMSIGKSMRAHCHRAISAEGFTMNETDVLLALTSGCGHNTVKSISESANISKGIISQAVDSLKQKGYIFTRTSDKDRRSVTIFLAEKAAAVREKLKLAEEEYFSKFIVSLPHKDKNLTDRTLDAIQSFSLPNF